MSGILYRTALRGSFRTTLAFEDGQQNDGALGRLARKRKDVGWHCKTTRLWNGEGVSFTKLSFFEGL